MSKETFYFSHDYNARTDRKLVNVIMKHGMTGIGVYWCLIEMLYEEGGYLPKEYDRISFELRTDINVIQEIIKDSELFHSDLEKFWSNAVLERLQQRCEKSEKARESINKRWNKYKLNTNVIRTNNKRNTIKERKVKESKINNISFAEFWDLYDRKEGSKKNCENKWNKLKHDEQAKIISIIPAYLKTITDKQFQPFPETWLNQRRWENEDLLKTKINGSDQLDIHGKPKPSNQYCLVKGEWTVL